MRALKALVISMGVLIVAGLIVVVVTIANRVDSRKPVARQAGPPEAAASLVIPAGAAILETALDAAQIAFRLRLAAGTTAIYIYARASGAPKAVHRIAPAE